MTTTLVNLNVTLNLDVVVVDNVSMGQSKLHREAGVGGEGSSYQEVLKRFDQGPFETFQKNHPSINIMLPTLQYLLPLFTI